MSAMRFDPARRLRGTVTAPADKSISHRAALLGAMGEDPVRIRNYLDAGDTNATLDALRALGAIVHVRPDAVVVRGTGLRHVQPAEGTIDVRNSGTLLRLLPGWLAGQPEGSWTLDGDASIRRRPVDRVTDPLRLMGARIEARDGRFAPFTVHGAPLSGIEYELPIASAQVKSSVLLAALTAVKPTTVIEPLPSRDHTERMLSAAGAAIRREPGRVTVEGVDELEIEELVVPGDASSAAFLITAGVLVAGSRLVIADVGVNWTRTGFLRILERMGAVVVGDLEPVGATGPDEPVSDLDVRAAPLVGAVVAREEVPLAIDELPLVALLGCFADGETIVRGAQELRVKETDRITAVVDGLRGLGARIEATADGFAVQGDGGLRGGRLATGDDHRLAMLGAVAGLASRDGVDVEGMEAAAVSYPTFLDDLARLAG